MACYVRPQRLCLTISSVLLLFPLRFSTPQPPQFCHPRASINNPSRNLEHCDSDQKATPPIPVHRVTTARTNTRYHTAARPRLFCQRILARDLPSHAWNLWPARLRVFALGLGFRAFQPRVELCLGKSLGIFRRASQREGDAGLLPTYLLLDLLRNSRGGSFPLVDRVLLAQSDPLAPHSARKKPSQ